MTMHTIHWVTLAVDLLKHWITTKHDNKEDDEHEYKNSLPPVRDAELQIDNTKK